MHVSLGQEKQWYYYDAIFCVVWHMYFRFSITLNSHLPLKICKINIRRQTQEHKPCKPLGDVLHQHSDYSSIHHFRTFMFHYKPVYHLGLSIFMVQYIKM